MMDEFAAEMEFFPRCGRLGKEEAESHDEGGEECQYDDAGDGASAHGCAVVGSVTGFS